MDEELFSRRLSRLRLIIKDLPNVAIEPENLEVEMKSFCKMSKDEPAFAGIAKAVMALANHGGGFVIVGFRCDAPGQPYIQQKPESEDLETWEQTKLHDALGHFMNPVPEVSLVKLPENSPCFPALIVEAISATPVVCTRNSNNTAKGRVYIRKPGPKSEEPFSPEEWRPVLAKCLASQGEELVSMIRNVITGVPAKSSDENDLQSFVEIGDSQFEKLKADRQADLPTTSFGRWIFAGSPFPILSRELGMKDLKHALDSSMVSESSLPIGNVRSYFPKGEPTTINIGGQNFFRAFIASSDFPYVDFWLADTYGQFYASRSYWEDVESETVARESAPTPWDKEGTRAFISHLHTRDLAEFLVHSLRFYKELSVSCGPVEDIKIRVCFLDLDKRDIVYQHKPIGFMKSGHVSFSHNWAIEKSIRSDLPEQNVPEVLPQFLENLWEGVFNLYKPPADFYQYAYKKAMGLTRD